MASPISMGLGLVGGIVSGIGQEQSAEAQASQLRYKAGVALLNKQINLQNAQWATESGDIRAQESGMKTRSQIAETKVSQSGSGFRVDTGTNAVIRQDQDAVGRFDQDIIRWDAAKTTWNFQSQAAMDQAESNLDMQAAKDTESAGQFAMIGSFLNAGAGIATKWSQASSSGSF